MGYTGDKETKVRSEKDKMGDKMVIDLPLLSLPDKWESITVRLLDIPEKYIGDGNEGDENGEVREFFAARCEVLVNDLADSLVLGNEYLLEINSTIYKGMLVEFKKNNIVVDKDLKCMVGRVWTIKGVEWPSAPKELWKIDEVTRLPIAPKTYRIAQRKDLETKDGIEYIRRRHNMAKEEKEDSVGTKPIVSFGMEMNLLNRMMNFLVSVNREVPMKFFKDRIVIAEKSCDNVQFAHIDISGDDLIKYEVNIDNDNTVEKEKDKEKEKDSYDIIVDTHRSSLENVVDICTAAKMMNNCGIRIERSEKSVVSRIVSIGDEFRDLLDDGLSNDPWTQRCIKKSYFVQVKVYSDRIIFDCPEKITLWAPLVKNENEVVKQHETLSRLINTIRKVRSSNGIDMGYVTIESGAFKKICTIESDKKYGAHYVVEISKENGLTLVSKTKDGFYELTLKPKSVEIACDEGKKHDVIIDKEYLIPVALLGENLPPTKVEIRTQKPIIIEQQLNKSGSIVAMLTIAPRFSEEECSEMEIKRLNEQKQKETIKEKLEKEYEMFINEDRISDIMDF